VDRPYVEQMRAVNCGCAKDVTLALTPLHALIGPNDSGKSTLLTALRAGVGSAEWPWNGRVTLATGDNARTRNSGGNTSFQQRRDLDWVATSATGDLQRLFAQVASHARLLRLDPDTMRRPTGLIPHEEPVNFDERGGRLPAVYDAILSRDRDAFIEIERDFVRLFPTVKSLVLENRGDRQKELGITLTDKTKVFANAMSEGMLYWLAIAALPYLAPAPIVLIEEPENGLHPARIAEVMRVLRTVSETTQVILATHSPLVVNEMKPDEVTIITRTPEDGTIATPMLKTKHFEQRSKIYALGELWLSYADGDLESELTGSETMPTKSAG
jgi:predicted ATPase